MATITKSRARGHPYTAWSPPTPDLPDPARLLAAWSEALRRCDAEAVTRLYSADTFLLPTADDDVRVGHAAIRDYFARRPRERPCASVQQRHSQQGWDALVDMGGLVFRFADGNAVSARYTLVWQPLSGVRRITHHLVGTARALLQLLMAAAVLTSGRQG